MSGTALSDRGVKANFLSHVDWSVPPLVFRSRSICLRVLRGCVWAGPCHIPVSRSSFNRPKQRPLCPSTHRSSSLFRFFLLGPRVTRFWFNLLRRPTVSQVWLAFSCAGRTFASARVRFCRPPRWPERRRLDRPAHGFSPRPCGCRLLRQSSTYFRRLRQNSFGRWVFELPDVTPSDKPSVCRLGYFRLKQLPRNRCVLPHRPHRWSATSPPEIEWAARRSPWWKGPPVKTYGSRANRGVGPGRKNGSGTSLPRPAPPGKGWYCRNKTKTGSQADRFSGHPSFDFNPCAVSPSRQLAGKR